MIAYAESGAVLIWLLGERGETAVRRLLAGAERVVSSTLTSVECARALARGVIMVSSSWLTLEMTGRVLDRARARFPHEPVRTLDALHLAAALMFHEAYGALTVVSLDERIRENAGSLGLSVAP